ncbi:hypothetical protein C8J57DRAFT_1293087 [Mycena rebaudengoi]|nr:hypothetical protein C8J57DRAFT_1293087 [Mycena rebaudengoi]
MGFTGLARWVNAPTQGLKLVQESILSNHNGQYKGPWNLSRSMVALTMDQNVFVLVEDPLAPSRADVLAAAPPGEASAYLQRPSHYRTTFLTLRPPGALEQLLTQLKARWQSVRASAAGAQRGQSGQQLTIEGQIFAIGTDWLVRIGNVILAGGAVKGMLLEAEYLPLPVLHSPVVADGTSELLSNLLTSVLPNISDAKTVAVTISDMQWEDQKEKEIEEKQSEDDIYAWGDEGVALRRKDWLGVNRDRRSAYLIIGGLRSEGIL